MRCPYVTFCAPNLAKAELAACAISGLNGRYCLLGTVRRMSAAGPQIGFQPRN
jgi:hypothetical protein